MDKTDILYSPALQTDSPELAAIARKVQAQERITDEDALILFEKASLPFVGALANQIRERKHGDTTYFNRNFHIEPTNVCVYSCHFCSYSRLYAHRDEGWELSIEQMMEMVKKYDGKPVTEVHIVGGVHPKMNLEFFAELLTRIKAHRPDLHIKGFTAVELDYMFRKAKKTVEEGMQYLHEAGLDSLPGGGAEIFAPEIREQICADKIDGEGWLNIHAAAHKLGMHSNATMLYGHIENYAHRVHHMRRLRETQDITGGFNTFIPLKFRNKENDMSHVAESSLIEDMKVYAIARIYLDNFPHIKAYWPMLGRQNAQLSLSFGVNDIDGTIDDTTRIYSMAGSEEQTPAMSTAQLVTLIKQARRKPVERGTLYNVIRDYSDIPLEEIESNPLLN
ncbi:MAG: aminofutalosine synthase MqnE [Sphingobacteriales bacterium SCN 48-20]|uniref:aminofutalosine synthase MqnE n=1 Tax=Terrimonas ferruginea TaxID=249 RepID=UPI000868935E|nr:aminofutalosine synthase MqnE [Terrimonas ferruginea]MBN8783982.1 aminofutalosine synthase MqnE [Terrimonas ferruginea]ODT94191.1 MAG: aminofutalosine synthase MqnE [Sphingobacteriales bacterium SCN 48-20]OJW41709.1 MAG: aminofutalosine synthase MqnE [Sphingobacteriales bacterium 48-107]